MDEIWGDERQSPSRESDEWNDPEWRAEWLCGLTDEELRTMNARMLGEMLPAFIQTGSGYRWFGQEAEDYARGIEIARAAGLSDNFVPRGTITQTFIKLGKMFRTQVVR